MRNFDPSFFFDKSINIGNVISQDLISDVSFTRDLNGKATATLNYADLKGKAVIGKKVNYKIEWGIDKPIVGVETTDANGNIRIGFIANQTSGKEVGKMSTTIQLDAEKQVLRNFPIQFKSSQIDLQFFPEGGNLIEGIRSRIGFKAIGTDGLGKDVSGTILNNNGEKIAEFKAEHAGMGSFLLRPLAGQNYTALVKLDDGTVLKIPLPKAKQEGFVLSVSHANSDSLLVKINASPGIVAQDGQISIIAQSNAVVKYVSKSKLNNTVLSAKIPKGRFPTGIVQFTLFNQQNLPVAERLIFINHNDFLNVALNGPKTSNTRKKVKIDLDVKDAKGKPAFGSFSVAVTDLNKTSYDVNAETTILSNLLLTSDIKGYVEQPNYYFNEIDAKKIQELDQLMLTQGWRRFTWDKLLTNNFQTINFQPQNGLSISGRISQNKKPVVGGKVTLMSTKGGMFVVDTLSDAQGRFSFNNLSYYDLTQFVIQARTAKDKSFVDIEIDKSPVFPNPKTTNTGDLVVNINKSMLPYLMNSYEQHEELRKFLQEKSIMLKEVVIEEKRKARAIEGSANLAGYADVVFTREDFENTPTISLDQFLIGRVAGLVIRDSIAYLTRSMYTDITKVTPMLLIVDGQPLNDPTRLAEINPFDVEGVEILKGPAASIYGSLGGGGVLIVTSKVPRLLKQDSNAEGIIKIELKGFHTNKEFYMPNYDQANENQRKPDLRTTIFWHPNIIVKDGKASFEFFNADAKGTYQVKIEGIDSKGNLARYTYSYQVN